MPKFGRTAWICLLLASVTIALYFPVTRFEFVNYDDGDYVSRNEVVQKGLTMSGVIWAIRVAHASNWHPVTWVSHMLDWEIYGANAGGHHFTNVLFHAANVVLLFLLLRRMTTAIPTSPQPSPPAERENVPRGSASDTTWRSAFVAALFAWHPLHVESVAWVSERKDVLSAGFFFLTIWAYVGYTKASEARIPYSVFRVPDPEVQGSRFKVQGSKFPAWFFYSLALFLFALGLMSKPMVVTLPFVLLLLDFWPLGRLRVSSGECRVASQEPGVQGSRFKVQGSRFVVSLSPLLFVIRHSSFVIWEKLPFLALAALDCRLTMRAQSAGVIMGLDVLPISSRIANALVSYVLYLWKMVWPTRLAVLYPWSHEWSWWAVAGAAVLLLAISAVALWQARQRPYLVVGWFWFLGTLVPVIGLMQVGIQSMADRYTYLPLIGIFIMIVWGIAECVTSKANIEHRTSNIEHRTSKTPHAPRSTLHVTAAAVLIALMICTHAQLQYWRDSVTLFGRAVAVTRDNLRAEYNLGVVLGERGQAQEAMRHYVRALEIKPNRLEAAGETQLLAHENLGIIFAKQAKWPEAEVQFRAALDEKPGYWQARSNLGGCLEAMGRFNEAVAEYRKALDDGAQGSDVWRHLGIALVGAGRSHEAEKAYREAVRLNPGGVAELNELAWFLATDPHSELRNGPEAVVLAQRACELAAGSEPKCLGTLDAAYAEAGRFPEAMETAQQARAMFLKQGQNGLADMASQRLELYRVGKPYRQQ